MITLNLDSVKFTSKPTGAVIGGVRNRLARPDAMQTIDPAELLEAIQRGQSFTPAAMTGGSGDTWQSQQVIVADNDTGTKDAEGHKIRLAEPLTPDEARAALAEYGIDPYAMYWTFSNRPDWPKFRIVIVLDEAIKDPAAAKDLTARLAYVLNTAREHCTDTSMADTARLLFGGPADCVFYRGQVTPTAKLWSLPAAVAPEAAPAAERPPMERPRVDSRGATLAALEARMEADKKTFDLRQFIIYDGGREVRHGKNRYVNPCPICGHNNCLQVTNYMENNSDCSKWHCFSNNHRGINKGTIIDYLKARDGLTDGEALEVFKFSVMGYDRDAWDAAREAEKKQWLETPEGKAWLEKKRSTAAEDFTDLDAPIPEDGAIGEPGDVEAAPVAEALAKPPADYTEYYKQCIANLDTEDEAQEHLMGMGLSMNTAKSCRVGYDPDREALIVPSTTAHYVVIPGKWIVDADDTLYYEHGRPEHVGKAAIMGEPVLYNADTVFITGNALDALAVIEAGAVALALNGEANAERLLKHLEEKTTEATLILCIGKSDKAKKIAETMRQGLRRLNVSYVDADLTGTQDTAHSHLMADRTAFLKAVELAKNATAEKPDNVALYLDSVFSLDVDRRIEIGVKPTGFSNLDEKTKGGLRPGLYLFGALSSLGKTTWCSQLADGMAENGAEVIYFSLEQSRLEMVSKSIAREMARASMNTALSGQDIADGIWRDTKDAPRVLEAKKRYIEKVGDRVSIVEAGFNCDTAFISNYVRRYYKRTGIRPVVVIDYLQVLENGEVARNKTGGTREAIEECIKQLVLLKRELDLTIICIVSLNRMNYQQKFSFEAIKETGLAEYSGDAIWGLQLRCLDEPMFNSPETKVSKGEKQDRIDAAKDETPRRLKLVAKKHRGQKGQYECYFDYYCAYDLFIPVAAPTQRKKV